MEAVDVLALYRDVVARRTAHCRVCLRTAGEVRLVAPTQLRAVLRALRLHTPSLEQALRWACYECEARAGAALRVVRALQCAAATHKLFTDIAHKKRVDQAAASAARSCGQQLAAVRARCSFTQTEALLVDSLGMQHVAIAGQPTPAPRAQALPAWQPGMLETVILDDDDDEPAPAPPPTLAPPSAPSPSPALPRLVPVEQVLASGEPNGEVAALLPQEMQVLARGAGDSFLLHPVRRGEGGALFVPSLGARLLSGALQPALPAAAAPAAAAPAAAAPAAGSVDSVLAQILRDKVVHAAGPGKRAAAAPAPAPAPEDKRPRAAPAPAPPSSEQLYIVDIDQIAQLIREGDDTGGGRVEGGGTGCDDATGGMGGGSAEGEDAGGGGVEKRPLPTGERVDWEDKIPMDVISFMDATDPCAGELIVPDPPPPPPPPPERALAVISHVRSLPPPAAGGGASCVIDLC